MEIFNTKVLNNRQRWNRALLYAILGSVVSILVCVFIQRTLHVRSSIVYLLAGLFLGWLVLESGHGVSKKFSILAAGCTVAVIILSDMFLFFGMSTFSHFIQALLYVLGSYLTISFNNLLSLVIKVAAIGIAYERSRVL